MKKAILIILDGWGVSPEKKGNGIWEATTKTFDTLITNAPHLLLKASSQEVGLPWGEVGNSEVGHLNIGLGRVVLQDLPQIDADINDKSFFQKPALVAVGEHLKKTKGALHIIGIASDGGVHGQLRHINSAIEWATRNAISKVFLHLITDGRDTPSKIIEKHLREIKKTIAAFKIVSIASVSGRYFAMDRDQRWERVEKAYKAMVERVAPSFPTAEEGIKSAYKKNQTDEFIEPFVVAGTGNRPFQEGDGVIFTNYRADRIIQLVKAVIDPNFNAFRRKVFRSFMVATMTNYEDNMPVKTIFSSAELNNPQINPTTMPVAEVVAKSGLKQLHLAETEKYAHITYFFNGGLRKPFNNEEQLLVPSPKVSTYDQKPEMSAAEVTDKLLAAIQSGKYGFILVNYANPDMVGHTGIPQAVIKAIETVDEALGRVLTVGLKHDYQIFITGDHGNADQMVHFETNTPHKEHTINPTPFFYLSPEGGMPSKIVKEKVEGFYIMQPSGILADIAPTVLQAIGLKQPEEMAGTNILEQFKLKKTNAQSGSVNRP